MDLSNFIELFEEISNSKLDLDVIFDNDQTSGNTLGVVKGTGTGADTSETGATITNPTTPNVPAPIIIRSLENFMP